MIEVDPMSDKISLHGLGFIQVNLHGDQRLHVWHPKLPRRKCFKWSQIHDHRWSFTSRVLVGVQINRVYKTTRSVSGGVATHASYLHEGKRDNSGNRPWDFDEYLHVQQTREERIPSGDEYFMPAYLYHSTHAGNESGIVVTIMKKTGQYEQGAHSLCEIGVDPDVGFDRRQWSDARLWSVVLEALMQK